MTDFNCTPHALLCTNDLFPQVKSRSSLNSRNYVANLIFSVFAVTGYNNKKCSQQICGKNFYILSTTDSKWSRAVTIILFVVLSVYGPEVGTSWLCDNVRIKVGSMMLITFLSHSSYRNSLSCYTFLDGIRRFRERQKREKVRKSEEDWPENESSD